MNDRKTLLVALDFGPHSDAVLSESIALADRIEAMLHLIHVFTPLDTRMSRNTYAYLNSSKHAQLSAAGARCRARKRLGSVMLHEGDPTAQILLAAEAICADMIVMGARARAVSTQLRLDGVVDAVIGKADCTVVIVRDKLGIHKEN